MCYGAWCTVTHLNLSIAGYLIEKWVTYIHTYIHVMYMYEHVEKAYQLVGHVVRVASDVTGFTRIDIALLVTGLAGRRLLLV